MLQLDWLILPLAAELRLQRLDRHAVGHLAAVAATLAHLRIDEGADCRVRPLSTLAQPAPFGGAGLVVEDRRDAAIFAELAAHRIHVVAVAQDRSRRQGHAGITVGLVGDQRHFLHAFGCEFGQDLHRTHGAFDRLAAGHRNEAVIEDLVGDRHVGRDRLTDRERAGMGVSAVAEIGEDVALGGEGLLPEPHRSLAAHMRGAVGLLGIDQDRHPVTADPRKRAAAVGDAGRAVVRAAGAEARTAHRDEHIAARGQRTVRRRRRGMVRIVPAQRFRNHLRHHFRRGFAEIWQPARAVVGIEHAAVEIFAHDSGRRAPAVKDRANLVFEQRPLFLDHDDEIEVFGEFADDDRIERPDHADLDQPEAQALAGIACAPRLPSACNRSCHALPAATIPTRAPGKSPTMRLSPFARA